MASFDVFDRRGRRRGGVEVTIAQSRGAIDQGESAPKGKESRSAVSEGSSGMDQDCMSAAQRILFLLPPPPSSSSTFVVFKQNED